MVFKETLKNQPYTQYFFYFTLIPYFRKTVSQHSVDEIRPSHKDVLVITFSLQNVQNVCLLEKRGKKCKRRRSETKKNIYIVCAQGKRYLLLCIGCNQVVKYRLFLPKYYCTNHSSFREIIEIFMRGFAQIFYKSVFRCALHVDLLRSVFVAMFAKKLFIKHQIYCEAKIKTKVKRVSKVKPMAIFNVAYDQWVYIIKY